jgi:hypothetical protein
MGGHGLYSVVVLMGMALLAPAPADAFLVVGASARKMMRPSNVRSAVGSSVPLQMQSNFAGLGSDALWLPSSHISRREALRFSAGCAAAVSAPYVANAAQGRDLPSLAQRAPEGNSVKLSNGGGDFPLMSFGLQVYDDETARKLTLVALEAGVRNFFSSVLAGNQVGFAKAVKESGVPRQELYICGSVVSNRYMHTYIYTYIYTHVYTYIKNTHPPTHVCVCVCVNVCVCVQGKWI